MISSLVIGSLIVGLIVLYLTQPRYEPLRLSAWRFVEDSQSSERSSTRLSLRSLVLSRPFYFQFGVLLLLLLATLLTECRQAVSERQGVAVGIVLDTSASMSTQQGGQTRMARARAEADAVLAHLAALGEDQLVCLELATFDMAAEYQRDLTLPAASALLQAVEARPLGTDLAILRQLVSQSAIPDAEDPRCMLTHLVIISDQPPPDWLAELPPRPQIVWRDIAAPVDNVGLTRLESDANAILGIPPTITVEISAYVEPSEATVSVMDANGAAIYNEQIAWNQPGSRQIRFEPPSGGFYTVSVLPGGNYIWDDSVTIDVEDAEQVRVDWQLRDRQLPALLGWQITTTTPVLRVVPYPASAPIDLPTLIVGDNRYGAAAVAERLDFFRDDHPLLEDIDLDTLERARIAGVTAESVAPLVPVALGTSGAVWIAAEDALPAAYLPGLPRGIAQPTGQDEESAALDALTTTLFFNSVRYLLRARQPAPLYTLTSPAQPEPGGNRAALHLGEGNTAQQPVNRGEIMDIQPGITSGVAAPIWPQLLVVAAAVFAFERVMAVFGGNKWR